MARMIEADALKADWEKLAEDAYQTHDWGIVSVLEDCIWEVDSQPTVDAVPVVHGHWCWQGKFRACSKCGSYVEFTETLGASFWKFCPYCGAKMDLEVKDA